MNTQDKRDADKIKKSMDRIRRAKEKQKERVKRSRFALSFGLLSGAI
jgi:hypothetical protein